MISHNFNIIQLTAKEFDLLYLLISHKEQVFTKEQIYENVWGYDYPADPNNLTSFIRKLRKKIEPEPDEAMTEKIIQAVELSKKFDNRFRERQYTPLPASWLNARGYLNEFAQEGGNGYGAYQNRRSSGPATDPGGFTPSGGFKGSE